MRTYVDALLVIVESLNAGDAVVPLSLCVSVLPLLSDVFPKSGYSLHLQYNGPRCQSQSGDRHKHPGSPSYRSNGQKMGSDARLDRQDHGVQSSWLEKHRPITPLVFFRNRVARGVSLLVFAYLLQSILLAAVDGRRSVASLDGSKGICWSWEGGGDCNSSGSEGQSGGERLEADHCDGLGSVLLGRVGVEALTWL